MGQKIKIDKKYNPYLAKIFSNKVITDLVKHGDSGYFNDILKSSGFINYLGDDPKFHNVFNEVLNFRRSELISISPPIMAFGYYEDQNM
jgi:hypothetical protein